MPHPLFGDKGPTWSQTIKFRIYTWLEARYNDMLSLYYSREN